MSSLVLTSALLLSSTYLALRLGSVRAEWQPTGRIRTSLIQGGPAELTKMVY